MEGFADIEGPVRLDLLEILGCDTAQGFYIRQPLQADELASWIDSKAGNGERWGSATPKAC